MPGRSWGGGIVGLALLVLLASCTPGAGSPSPKASASVKPATAPPPSPAVTAAPSPVAGGSPSTIASCTGSIPTNANLVLGTLTGSSTVVLRDITNTSSARTICTFAGSIRPRFATPSVIAWVQSGPDIGSPGQITRLDIAAATVTTPASWSGGGFGAGNFDWSPNGSALTYIGPTAAGSAWHLLTGGHDLVLANLPPVPGRGVSREDDDWMLGFSPDGLYIALVETFATGGSGDSSPVQVRRASDGALVYSASSGTMGVWASVPSRLFFRSSAGVVSRWDPGSGVSVMQSGLKWVRPHGSPDGRWIAYTSYDSAGHPGVHLYSVQGNSLGPSPAGLRSGALFLNNNLLWYQEETPCDCGPGGQSQLTGNSFLYGIGGSTENGSRISGVFDVWPRVTAPPALS